MTAEPEFNWKRIGASVTIDRSAVGEKRYIIVSRNGKQHIRKYKRSLKNGLNVFDLAARAILLTGERIKKDNQRRMFRHDRRRPTC